ncbi:hypothetical protein Cgig2_013499 [Carnegiea gigantea]|uniref:Disease resistance protein n=1 Tax=Carnegiea gigantea TaxID=171969 RepID=A0A9Q1K0R8_9CARY|nr:hypothetical protein Cgig2_013499 [Carnegiea gigantea]
MDFLTPLMSIVDKSFVLVARKIGHVVHFKHRVQGMLFKLEELKGIRDDLKREVDRAELEGLESTEQVQRWLQQVDEAESEIALILHSLCSWKVGCCVKCKLSKKALDKVEKINELITRKASVDVCVVPIDTLPTKPTVGLTAVLRMALKGIADDEIGIIGI